MKGNKHLTIVIKLGTQDLGLGATLADSKCSPR